MMHHGVNHGSRAGRVANSLFDDGWQAVDIVRARASGESTTDQLDPRHLFEMAKQQPLLTVIECQKYLAVLEDGYQKQRRRFIAISYAAAFYLARDEAGLIEFDQLLVNQHVIKKPDVEATRERLIYRVLEITFAKTRMSSSNTAYRYAHGLEHYFAGGMQPENLANMLVEHGPEKLYKEAVKRNQSEARLANMTHQRHLDQAKNDGRYAAKLLALDPANIVRAVPDHDETTSGEEEDDDDGQFDDEDDEDDPPPSWRSREVAQRFDKMMALAAQLSAEIAESKVVLEDDPDDEDNPRSDDLLRDDDMDTNDWKNDEVQSRYERLQRRAVQVGAELVELKALLADRVR